MPEALDPAKLYKKPLALSHAERRQIDQEVPKKMSRAEAKDKKELEEARKDGTAMPEKDEKGEMINPHIPNYIASVPWYIDPEKKPSLFHQHKLKAEAKHTIGDWYHRGVPDNKTVGRFRKGACANCGAMTHKQRDCLERPRKRGAKWSGADIAPDEFVQPNLDLGFEGKRDRWNGYDPARHRFEVFEEFSKVDIARKAINAQRLQNEIEAGEINNPDIDLKNEDKYGDDEVKMHSSAHVDSRQTVSVRNLRIREDTAKYLRNLDSNSAFYDPKTRSMRENPYEETGKNSDDVPFAGENFIRYTGESKDFAQAQVFALDAMDKGVDVHFHAEPTKAAVLRKSYRGKKEEHSQSLKNSVIEKYGGVEHLQAPPKELLIAQTEHYVEYSRTGQVIKGQEKAKIKSRFEEDVLIGNHSAVWGSYWEAGQWGYGCCNSCIKASYCLNANKNKVMENEPEPTPSALVPQVMKHRRPSEVGEENESVRKVSLVPPKLTLPHKEVADEESSEDEHEGKSLVEIHQAKLEKEKPDKKDPSTMNKKELKKHLKAEKKAARKAAKDEIKKKEQEIEMAVQKERERILNIDTLMKTDERKRKYNSMNAVTEPTDAELEAFKRTRVNHADPMGHFLSK